MGVQVSFRVGRHSGKFDAANSAGMNSFMASLDLEVQEQAAKAVSVDVNQLQSRLDRLVRLSLQRAVNHARLNIVGLVSAHGSNRSPTQIYFDNVDSFEGNQAVPRGGVRYTQRNKQRLRGVEKMEWPALAGSTRVKKMKAGLSATNARRHFLFTGALRGELGDLARSITNHTGTVSVSYKTNPGAKRFNYVRGRGRRTPVTIGQVRLTFLPQVPLSRLPGLMSGRVTDTDPKLRFERNLGLSSSALEKLEGPKHGAAVHRPLLQPIITYWMLYRTPVLVQDAILRSIKG
jgi:hypothetical protein